MAARPPVTVATEPFEARDHGSEAAAGLSPQRRVEALCDPGTIDVIRSAARSAALGADGPDGDGVFAAAGRVEGRPVLCFAQDGRVAGGSLGEAHAETICRVLDLAASARVPMVGFVESAGARMQEGALSLNGYARVFRRMVEIDGRVPQISIATGASAGGGCYCSALTDFTIMTRGAGMFLTGPRIVEEVTGEAIEPEALGGYRVHRKTGVCQVVAADELEAVARARQLLSYLPTRAWEGVPPREPRAPLAADPSECVPRLASRVYDVREVIARLVDGGEMLELGPHWAWNMVTGLARLDGRSVGIVANQPLHRGGVIDADASQKAARFVGTCANFGLPLIVLVDTPGFMPGSKQESAGVIRHGAALLRAFASAPVPRITLILRQAFGGGYITMNSRDLGADFSFAWPQAVVGIMGARQAVGVVRRAEIAAAADSAARREELAADYAERQTAQAAARDGVIDEVVEATETRVRLCGALATLTGKCPQRPLAAFDF